MQLTHGRQQPAQGGGVDELLDDESANPTVEPGQLRERRRAAQIERQTCRVGAMSHHEITTRDEPRDRCAGRAIGRDRRQLDARLHHHEEVVADTAIRRGRGRGRVHDRVDARVRRHPCGGDIVPKVGCCDHAERQPVRVDDHQRVLSLCGHLSRRGLDGRPGTAGRKSTRNDRAPRAGLLDPRLPFRAGVIRAPGTPMPTADRPRRLEVACYVVVEADQPLEIACLETVDNHVGGRASGVSIGIPTEETSHPEELAGSENVVELLPVIGVVDQSHRALLDNEHERAGLTPLPEQRLPPLVHLHPPVARQFEQLRLVQKLERREAFQEIGDSVVDGRSAHW